MDTPATLPPAARKKPGRRSVLIGSLIALLAVAAVGGVAWYLTHREPAGPGPGGRVGRPSTTVGVATATAADMPVVVDALGTVMPAAMVTVRPQVGGVLQQILFREGDMVRAGQVLATIDPRQYEMALMQTSGQRQRDEAQLASAKVTLARFQTLLAQDSIARQEVDTQQALVKQLEGTVLSDRAAEGTARLNLGYSKITAPIAGRVGLRVVDAGNVVNVGDAAGIVVITQVTPIDVQFAVPQDQVANVLERSSGKSELAVTAFDRTRVTLLGTGRFSTLDNLIDVQTGTVKAKARFANDKMTLFPNQFVNVRLELRTITGAVTIPVTALRHGSKGDFVYVLNSDRTAGMRLVSRGQADVAKVEITTGLKLGERVITEGGDRLSDGAAVSLPGDKPGGKGRRNGAGGAAGEGKAAALGADGKPVPAGERRRRPQPAAAP
ncbi:efflux RND transporter periplasmic adaptor subunit [Actimicrobium sp. CCI2.3]|uniref:efflux RND transporter periplasmic adaptor subunit n=1 Tax=Actimicrobium sp. CCI2.3 TaxID=3048616 RepID=UPI002AB4CF6A|nr:efflux RND transporter periplasmic adaptor subunit [Actimicrobium sp. CCI2.3]MDY7575334.1 efflux RND transporter periplasmic adaptor subunit [Actimicrobium sp. CCI2.3]MEB0023682.1 efflux RND transporter periplasmic adaptor subunit [Actimicrobium sp. CCI2.3]